MVQWTLQQVEGVAPSANTLKNARKLVNTTWTNLGGADGVYWGEVKGSGKKPYEVAVDLSAAPAYRCTCSSRETPCKHAVALLLIQATDTPRLTVTTPPAWINDWQAKRTSAQKAKTKPRKVNAKTLEKRRAAIMDGLEGLDGWLQDMVRNGLADVPSKPRTFYTTPAKRLQDAKAPTIARRVEELATIPHKASDWTRPFMHALGELHLMVEGFRHYDDLSAEMQADLRTAVGWYVGQNELVDADAIRDHWQIIGATRITYDKLREQRLWAYGQNSGQIVLFLEFAYNKVPFTQHDQVGDVLDADVVIYPSATPQRAFVRERYGSGSPTDALPTYATITDALNAYSAAVAKSPFIERFPMGLADVHPVLQDKTWFLVDRDKLMLPLHDDNLTLYALSSGHPLRVFGEWHNKQFTALTATAHDTFAVLG
jgi:hypothetical protein